MSWQEIKQEIQAIPQNGPVLDELCNVLETEETIALVGSGASAELWPMWEEFLEMLLQYSRQCRKINQTEFQFFQKEALKNPLATIGQLRNKIDNKRYSDYVQEIFSDKISPQTGEAFTSAHKALLQLPIQNYLTLCYDAGLTNARSYLYPKSTTPYYFWDQEEVRNILEPGEYKRLIVHAHGRYDRSSSLILTLEDCRRAYSDTPSIRLADNLFESKRLILIGFEPDCPYIKQLLSRIIGDYKQPPFRHIALIGLSDEEIQVAYLLREREEMAYGAQILFYPSKNNHEALSLWLNALVEKYPPLSTDTKRSEETKSIRRTSFERTVKDKSTHSDKDRLPWIDPDQRSAWQQAFSSGMEKLTVATLKSIYRAVSTLKHNKTRHLFNDLAAGLKTGKLDQAGQVFNKFEREYRQVIGLINQSLGASFFSNIDTLVQEVNHSFESGSSPKEIKDKIIPLKKVLKKTLVTVFNYLEGMQHNFNSLVKAAVKAEKEMLRNQGIQLSIELESEENMVELFLNKEEITDVFLNLIWNAAESFPPEQKEKLITVRSRRRNDSIELWVIDNGRGIEKEHWESIFDYGYTIKEGSDGQGLFLVKKAVFKNGGSIQIEDSRVGQGTTFKIDFEV